MDNKLFDSIIKAKGVGQIILKKFNDKQIYTKVDLLLHLPIGLIDRRFWKKNREKRPTLVGL